MAVNREHTTIPNHGASFRLQPNDLLMVLGLVEDAERLETARQKMNLDK